MASFADGIEHGIRIVGYSLAGEETFVACPELDVAFDVGRAPRELLAINHVFLSHGHMDHAAGVAYYFAQRMFLDNSPGRLYLSKPLEAPVRALLRTWAGIDGHEPPSQITVVQPGVDVPLRRDLLVRPFEVNHPCRRHDGSVVQSLGFAAIEVRQKLLDEYQGLTGPQIVELKRQGVPVTRRVEIPLVCYCGDTAPGPFLELDFVRRSRILLLECTFFEPDHVGRARDGSHIHVSDLRRIVPRLSNDVILLTHVSRRTALSDAKAILRRELGDDLAANVRFLMELRRRRPARDPHTAPERRPGPPPPA